MAGVTFQIKGHLPTDFLDSIIQVFNDKKIVKRFIRQEASAMIKKNFQTMPRGIWPEHSPLTIAKRARLGTWRGKHESMLRETYGIYIGTVNNPIIKQVGDAIEYRPSLSGDKLRIAKWQQFGTTRRKWKPGQPIERKKVGKGIPPRPFLGLFDKDFRKLSKLIFERLVTKARVVTKRKLEKSALELTGARIRL